jgi:hypothetical protein
MVGAVLLGDLLPCPRCRECGGWLAVKALAERADRQIGSPDGLM